MNKKNIIIIFFVVFIAFGIGYLVGNTYSLSIFNYTSTKNNTNKKYDNKIVTNKEKKYSLSKFTRIKMGMTYDEVKSILGNGVKDQPENIDSASVIPYTWENDDGSYINIYFLQNKVFQKKQVNLDNNMNVKVTKEDFSNVKKDMTYDEVKSILGNGQLYYQSYWTGTTNNESYKWINSDKSYIEVSFKNGKVSSRYTEGLK